MIKNKLAWNRINDILLKFEGVTYQYTDRRRLKLSHSFTVLSVLVKLKARKVKTLAIYYHTTSIFSISQQFHILQTYVLAFQRFFSFIQENVIWIVRLLVLPSHLFPPCFPFIAFFQQLLNRLFSTVHIPNKAILLKLNFR